MNPPSAIFVTSLGGPEVMHAGAIDMPVATQGLVLIEHSVIAVNYVENYLRAGPPDGHNPEPPFGITVPPAWAVCAISR